VTPVSIGERITACGQQLWLCGRLVTELRRPTGMTEFDKWCVCGGVYCTRWKPQRMSDLVFVPWVYPCPMMNSKTGDVGISMFAQLTTDISEAMEVWKYTLEDTNYIGRITMSVQIKRRTGPQRTRNFHVGEVYRTEDHQQLHIFLRVLPFTIMEYHGKNRDMTPIIMLQPEFPKTQKRKAAAETMAKNAQKRRMVQAGRPRLTP